MSTSITTPKPQPCTRTAAANPEQAMVTAILAGDPKAMERMYHAYAPYLLKRLTRLTGSLDQAEEALQQVFVQALQNLPSFRKDGKLLAWLNRIATNLVFAQFRREQRWHEILQEWLPQRDVATQPTQKVAIPERLYLEEERKQVLYEALSSLDPRKRIALILCDLEGLTQEQAAHELSLPVGTVTSRLFHGRKALRKRLQATLRRQGTSLQEWLYA